MGTVYSEFFLKTQQENRQAQELYYLSTILIARLILLVSIGALRSPAIAGSIVVKFKFCKKEAISWAPDRDSEVYKDE